MILTCACMYFAAMAFVNSLATVSRLHCTAMHLLEVARSE